MTTLQFIESFVLACSRFSSISVEQSHEILTFTICFIKYTEISQNKAGIKAKTLHRLQSLRRVIFVVIKNNDSFKKREREKKDPKASFSSKPGQQIHSEMEVTC